MGKHALPKSRSAPEAVRQRVEAIVRQAHPGVFGQVSCPTVWRAAAIASMAMGGVLYISVGSPAYAESSAWVIPELGHAQPAAQHSSQLIPELETAAPKPQHGSKVPFGVLPRGPQYLRKNDNLPHTGEVRQSDQPVLPNMAPPVRKVHPSKLRSAMVRHALANVGHIHESPPGSNRGPDIRRLTGGLDGIEWCSAEASSVINATAEKMGLQSPIYGGHTYGMGLPDDVLIRVNENPASPQVMSLQQWGQAVGAYHSAASGYQPQPGDVAIFRGHTGIVVRVGGDLATADGNWGNQDQVVHRPLESSYIEGFINIEEAFAGHGQAQSAPAAPQPVAPAPVPAQPGPAAQVVVSSVPDVPAVPGVGSDSTTAQPAGNDIPTLPEPSQTQPEAPASADTPPAQPPAATPPVSANPNRGDASNAVQANIPQSSVDEFNANILPRVNDLKDKYQKVAAREGVPWQMLAAVDHEESGNSPDRSSLAGEPLGTPNPDHPNLTAHSKEEALHLTAQALKRLAGEFYGVDATGSLSVSQLEQVFVAYNRGGLYKVAGVPADRSPYAANGLDHAHQNMSWVGPPADTVSGVDRDTVGAVAVYMLLGGSVSS